MSNLIPRRLLLLNRFASDLCECFNFHECKIVSHLRYSNVLTLALVLRCSIFFFIFVSSVGIQYIYSGGILDLLEFFFFPFFKKRMHKLLLENIVLWGNNNLVFRLKLVNFQETTDFLHRFMGLKKKHRERKKKRGREK